MMGPFCWHFFVRLLFLMRRGLVTTYLRREEQLCTFSVSLSLWLDKLNTIPTLKIGNNTNKGVTFFVLRREACWGSCWEIIIFCFRV